MAQLQELAPVLVELKGQDALTDIVEQTLGKDAKVMNCTPKQVQALKVILGDMQDAVTEAQADKE